jgi:D-ribulokinase
MQQTWLGIDAGTQSMKAVLVDTKGGVLSTGSVPLQSVRSARSHHQDPHWWQLAAEQAIRECLEGFDPARQSIGGLSITATSGTITTLDAAGNPLSDGLMYDDAAADGSGVRAAGALLWERLGYAMSDSWALAKAVGLAAQLPAGATIANQADVIASRLVGHRVASDWSHSLKTGYDTQALAWPLEVMATLGIEEWMLPQVVAPGTHLGVVDASAAERTGLPEGTPVIAGMTDGCTSQIASGALEVGASASSIGTTLVVKTVSSLPLGDRLTGVYSHRSPSKGQWFVGGASNVGAGIISQLFQPAEVSALSAGLDSAPIRLPLVYPLAATGERFPFTSSAAHGFILDSSGRTPISRRVESPRELFAGIMQGIAIVERWSFDALADAGAEGRGPVALLGGASGNRWWSQLRADTLERSVRVPTTPSAAVGAAIIAASGVTGEDLASHANHMVSYSAELEPDARAVEIRREAAATLAAELCALGWRIPGDVAVAS